MGVDVWCSAVPGSLVPGKRWRKQLEANLQESSGFLLLFGKDSGWVEAELDYALDRNANDQSYRIIPLLLLNNDPSELPPFLRSFEAMKLFPSLGNEIGASNILGERLKGAHNLDFARIGQIEPHELGADGRASLLRKWSWRSTPETVWRGHISILAIVETAIAVGLSIYVAILMQTLAHIQVAALMAPLLLLQTRKSMQWSIQWSALLIKLLRWLNENLDGSRSFHAQALAYILGAISAFFGLLLIIIIRCLATAVSLARHPLEAIRAVPDNWSRVAMSLDVMHPHEILQGIECMRKGTIDPQFAVAVGMPGETEAFEMLRYLRPRYGLLALGAGIVVQLILVLFSYAVGIPKSGSAAMPFFLMHITSVLSVGTGVVLVCVPLVYRWSLKSTALIWSPFIWIVRMSFFSRYTVRTRLRLLSDDAWGKLVFLYSCFAALAIAAKTCLYFDVYDMGARWRQIVAADQIDFYVRSDSFPVWQIAMAINTVLAIILHIYAHRLLILMDESVPVNRSRVDRALNACSFVRLSLSYFTILSVLLLLIQRLH